MIIKLSAFADEAAEDLFEQIKVLNEENIPYIEVRGINGKNVGQISLTEAQTYREMLDAGNIKVWSIGSPIGKIGISDDIETHFRMAEQIFEVAHVLGTDKIRVFSLFTTAPDRDESIVFDFMERLLTLAERHNVKLYHENEKGIYGDTAIRCRRLLDRFPTLNSIFDPANYVQCHVDVQDAIRLLGHDTGYYHIKDAQKEGGEIVPAGYGDGCLKQLIDSISVDTVLTLEPHLAVFSGYSHIDKTVMKHTHEYATSREAFGAAASAIKKLLTDAGYKVEGNQWKK